MKTYLITGGTSGLGLELCKQLVGRGDRVATFSRRVEKRIEDGNFLLFKGDISNKLETHSIAATAYSFLGHVDVLINNASVLGPTPLPLLMDLACEDLEAVLQANLIGPFRLTKLMAAGMIERKRGTIVNISSDAAVNGYEGWGAYSISKAALDQMTRVLAAELAPHGVRAVSIDPGDMRTPMHFQAIPSADPNALKDPALSARQLLEVIDGSKTLSRRIKLG